MAHRRKVWFFAVVLNSLGTSGVYNIEKGQPLKSNVLIFATQTLPKMYIGW